MKLAKDPPILVAYVPESKAPEDTVKVAKAGSAIDTGLRNYLTGSPPLGGPLGAVGVNPRPSFGAPVTVYSERGASSSLRRRHLRRQCRERTHLRHQRGPRRALHERRRVRSSCVNTPSPSGPVRTQSSHRRRCRLSMSSGSSAPCLVLRPLCESPAPRRQSRSVSRFSPSSLRSANSLPISPDWNTASRTQNPCRG